MNNSLIFLFVITLTAFIICVVIFFLMINKKRNQNQKKLIVERGRKYDNPSQLNEIPKKVKLKSHEKSNVNIKKKLKLAERIAGAGALSPSSVRYMLIQAGSNKSLSFFWILSALSAILFLGIGLYFNFSRFVLVCFVFTGFLGFPRFILKMKVNKRQKNFLQEMPDALEAMVRLLKSGMPISEAIAMTSREFSGPIGEEITKVYEAQRVGDTLPEAVQGMAFRVPTPEVKMFATAITIQAQTGSSLSEVLQNLANVIRQRFRLKRKIKALSAEARISAGIIAALPVSVSVGMYFLNREYIEVLWITEQGRFMLYGSIGWMLLGCFIMQQMISFKI
jgi:tight adherence protein B